VEMTLRTPGSEVDVHLMVPPGVRPAAVRAGGDNVAFRTSTVRRSDYVDFSCRISGETRVEVLFQ